MMRLRILLEYRQIDIEVLLNSRLYTMAIMYLQLLTRIWYYVKETIVYTYKIV